MIPYGRQDITEDDINAVVSVLRSDFITQGPTIEHFERTVSMYCNAEYGVAVNSATSALHIACLALGLGPGDHLWTSPNTFVASANCGLYCGAKVDFVDIDPRSYNICTKALAIKLLKADKKGDLPKIVVPVHFAGQSCDMVGIKALADRYGFKILEDASHAIGGRYNGEPIGSCRYSDISVFSFHPVKIITTGEGGIALTNDSKLAAHMASLRAHGITRDPSLMQGEFSEPWYYQQVDLGFNYRMNDIQAALGLSQIQRIDDFVRRRHQLAMRYNEHFYDFPIILPFQYPGTYSAFHLYVIQIDSERTSVRRRTIFDKLRKNGIGVNVHYIPVNMQPYYQQRGANPGDCPEAARYYARAISLPLFPTMTGTQQNYVIDSVGEALR